MSKRTYNKKSAYWKKFEEEAQLSTARDNQIDYEPALMGEPFYVSTASTRRMSVSRASSSSRINRSAIAPTIDRFSSIRGGSLPYNYAMDGVHIREAIELCQKAYATVAVFRNAVDIMAEFANTDIFLEGGTKKSRDFFYEWFKKINLNNLKDQYFREYYRSGNIFLYRIDGKFEIADFMQLLTNLETDGETNNSIPLKYILLNPFDVVAKRSSTFATGVYEKVLSEYELARLQNPSTDADRQILNGFPPDVQKQIKKGAYTTDGLKIELDSQKLSFSFYKKQDYEPFAIPFGYPVLEDINAKMELKKMDQAITRTIENVILLITMGAEPDKGGINERNLAAMQNLFRNESVGRVLVSDYTTKAEFVIPDLNRVLGPEKYKVLNEDIKQGLQNIVMGEEKFSSTQVKAQIFIDRLKESRLAFVNDFLQGEIKRVAKNLGFRSYPQAVFKDIDMRDEVQLMRVSTRLMELGILTPQQGVEMFHTGRFPDPEDIAPAQEEFVSQRAKGYYNPIVGGVPVISASESDSPEINKTAKSPGRPEGTTGIPLTNAAYSRKSIESTIGSLEGLRASAKEAMKQKMGIKRFNKNHERMIDQMCEAVACSTDLKNWNEKIVSCVNNAEEIANLNVLDEILNIATEHELDTYSASVLYHSKAGSN
jgi:hypothetical protein